MGGIRYHGISQNRITVTKRTTVTKMAEKRLIYAVDDEENIRELYFCALTGAGFDCECFADGTELAEAMKKRIPDLILLDIMLEGADGYEILKNLKAEPCYSAVPVIMVSAKGEEISKVKGLNMGADDYISKPFGVLELVARINAGLRRVNTKSAFIYGDIKIDDNRHTVSVNGQDVSLTLKEYDLLKLLVASAPDVVHRDEIFNKVWGEDYFGETRTLDIHVASLRKALKKSSVKIITVRGVGYHLGGL